MMHGHPRLVGFLLAAAAAWGQQREDDSAGPAAASSDATPGGFDHSLLGRILEENVTEDGWVDYENIRRTGAADLRRYLDLLAGADVDRLGSEDEQKAFWINAYNAICVRTLIDKGLPDSVPRAVLFGTNIFREKTYRVAGKVRSLEEIEHEILRPKFRDPRVHAALVCGASSCPRLRPEAYTGERLDAQLEEECRRWIQEEKTREGMRKNFLDRERKVFHVSKIFDWFEKDFGGEDGVLAFVEKYAGESDREFMAKNEVRLAYLPYSWKLNRK